MGGIYPDVSAVLAAIDSSSSSSAQPRLARFPRLRILPLAPAANRHGVAVASYLHRALDASRLSYEELAPLLSIEVELVITPDDLRLWTTGEYAFPARVLSAAFALSGLTESEWLGFEVDRTESERLKLAVASLKVLLNDPAALQRRAAKLRAGEAVPII